MFETETTNETTISHNGFSVDCQAIDAMNWLRANSPDAFHAVTAQFPEYLDHTLNGAWFDTEAMGVDVEWGSWLVDAIEETGLVWWEEGEPWAEAE